MLGSFELRTDALFGRDLTDPARRAAQRRMLGDQVVSYLTSG